jgi:hypothetical protein
MLFSRLFEAIILGGGVFFDFMMIFLKLEVRRLKKYQRETWKTEYFENKNIFFT